MRRIPVIVLFIVGLGMWTFRRYVSRDLFAKLLIIL